MHTTMRVQPPRFVVLYKDTRLPCFNPSTSSLLRQVRDRLFHVFRGHVRMTRASMLDGVLQLRDACVHMRIFPCLQGMLQGRIRTGQEWPHMTLFAMVRGFLSELDGILAVLVL